MEPGIQMDSLIARKIWRSIVISDTDTGESYMIGQADHSKVPIPKFSTDTDDAHKIVEFFQSRGWTFRVRHIPENDTYETCFYKDNGLSYRFMSSDTLPMAICIAGLAVMDESNIIK